MLAWLLNLRFAGGTFVGAPIGNVLHVSAESLKGPTMASEMLLGTHFHSETLSRTQFDDEEVV